LKPWLAVLRQRAATPVQPTFDRLAEEWVALADGDSMTLMWSMQAT
jgi:hypothetical protein